MTYEAVDLNIKENTLFITLHRPEVHNAMNKVMLNELTRCFREYEDNSEVRCVVLTGEGSSFSAGADLNWMKSMIDYSEEENIRDSSILLELYDSMYYYPKPIIAKVNGHAFGGGIGLMAVSDIVIAVPDAKFSFGEINLGLIPSVISTFVVKRIGEANMKRLFITGEMFDSTYASKIGLVDYVASSEDLDDEVSRYIEEIQSSSPHAVKEVKEMMKRYDEVGEEEYKESTVKKIAELRVSSQGQEGIEAFLEKRKPRWSDHR